MRFPHICLCLFFCAQTIALSAAALSLSNADWTLKIDPASGALVEIRNANDTHRMNWLREAGRWEQMKWIPDNTPGADTRGGKWGLVETSLTGLLHEAKSCQTTGNGQETVYETPALTVTVRRELREDGLHESYTFKNTSITDLVMPLGSVSINAPLFDQYPGATRSLTSRCHVHLWMGGNTAWINATRMGADAPHLGMILTEGSLAAYSQRNATFGDRGTFLLHPAAIKIPRHGSHTISWHIFWHEGWDDFFAKIARKKNVVRMSAQRYTVQVSEPIKVIVESAGSLENAKILANNQPVAATRMDADGKTLRATIPTSLPGEVRIELENADARTWLNANITAAPDALIDARVRFIVRNQQRNLPGDPTDGAYLAYDNETGRQIYDTTNDHNAGRERMAMGVLGALYLPRCRDEAFRQELAASLKRYAIFVSRELEDESGTVYGSVGRKKHERLYNFPWAAHLHMALYKATGETEQLDRMVRVLRSYYAHGGVKYYAIGIRITDTLATLAGAGRETERAELLANFQAHADAIIKTGTNYPPFEVNYEQSIVAPAVQLLLEVYHATGEQKYLEGARTQMRILEAFGGRQPDHRLNEISIRHWDDYWFGKLKLYGDTFPHYWSCITGLTYAFYGKALGDGTSGESAEWLARAETAIRGNLSLFTPDGRGSAAHVYAFSTNGERAARNDPWANDQDWALVHLLLLEQLKQK